MTSTDHHKRKNVYTSTAYLAKIAKCRCDLKVNATFIPIISLNVTG